MEPEAILNRYNQTEYDVKNKSYSQIMTDTIKRLVVPATITGGVGGAIAWPFISPFLNPSYADYYAQDPIKAHFMGGLKGALLGGALSLPIGALRGGMDKFFVENANKQESERAKSNLSNYPFISSLPGGDIYTTL
jgi:hypothetical protein